MERRAAGYITRIDALGGMIEAIEQGYPQAEIAEASYQYQQSVERGERVTVGVNRFAEGEDAAIELLEIDPAAERAQVARVRGLRARRDGAGVRRALDGLRRAAAGSENTMPAILEAVKAYATVGEICAALADVYGRYQERSIL
jgi:methylmalonyl-CoA mutase N-terminal domain/subunit